MNAIKIYLLVNLDSYEFARFSHLGTWKDVLTPCHKCETNYQDLVEPLRIEWDPGSTAIGDFSWCGYTMITTDKVRAYLQKQGFECTFGRVEVMAPSTKRRRGIVPYPYTGPSLFWLRPNLRISADESKSALEIKSDCTECGRKTYKFRMDGVTVRRSEAGTAKMFRIAQFGLSHATFVTESALEEILNGGFVNFHYKEAGEAV